MIDASVIVARPTGCQCARPLTAPRRDAGRVVRRAPTRAAPSASSRSSPRPARRSSSAASRRRGSPTSRRAAGVSTGTVHYYFDTRDEVLIAALKWASARLFERVEQPGDDPPALRLARLLRLSVPYPGPSRDEYVLWLELWVRALHQPDLLPQCEAFSSQWRGCSATSSAPAPSGGDFTPAADPDEVAERLVAFVDGLGFETDARLPLDVARAHARPPDRVRRRAARRRARRARRSGRRRERDLGGRPARAAARGRRLPPGREPRRADGAPRPGRRRQAQLERGAVGPAARRARRRRRRARPGVGLPRARLQRAARGDRRRHRRARRAAPARPRDPGADPHARQRVRRPGRPRRRPRPDLRPLRPGVHGRRGATSSASPRPPCALDLERIADAVVRTGARMVWICDPNNPTGLRIGARRVAGLPRRRRPGGRRRRRRGVHGLRRAGRAARAARTTSPTAAASSCCARSRRSSASPACGSAT